MLYGSLVLISILLFVWPTPNQTTIHRHFYCANQEGTKTIMCTHPEQIIGNATIVARVFKSNTGPCIPNQAADNRIVEASRATILQKCIGLKKCRISIGSPQTIQNSVIDHYEVAIDCFHVIEMCSTNRDYVGLDGFVVSPYYPSKFAQSSCQLYISLPASDLELVIEVHEFSLMYSIGCVSQYLELITDQSRGRVNDPASWTQLFIWCGRLVKHTSSSTDSEIYRPYRYGSHRNVPPTSTVRTGTNNLYIVLATAINYNNLSSQTQSGYRNDVGSIFKIRFWGESRNRRSASICGEKKGPNATTKIDRKLTMAEQNVSTKVSKGNGLRTKKLLLAILLPILLTSLGASLLFVILKRRSVRITWPTKLMHSRRGNHNVVCCSATCHKKIDQRQEMKVEDISKTHTNIKLIQPLHQTKERKKLIPERILNVEDMCFTKPISKELLETEVYGASSSIDELQRSTEVQSKTSNPTAVAETHSVKKAMSPQGAADSITHDSGSRSCSMVNESPTVEQGVRMNTRYAEKPEISSQRLVPMTTDQVSVPNPLSVLFKRNSSVYYTTDFV
ncbi:hypothetical protein ACOME3_009638 [Neoechinorhynchus agilis]